jgi:hypothetical protein
MSPSAVAQFTGFAISYFASLDCGEQATIRMATPTIMRLRFNIFLLLFVTWFALGSYRLGDSKPVRVLHGRYSFFGISGGV